MNYTKKGVANKQKALNSKSGKLGRKLGLIFIKAILIVIIAVGIVGVSAGIGAYQGILASTPSVRLDDIAPVGEVTFVYDVNGNKIDELVAANANRIFVTMEQIPEDMAHAIVAIEDERFYEHNGIDVKGLLRAGYQFLKTMGDETQGASTITQQLLKNTIFTDWTSEGDNIIKKVKRKLQEQYLAIELTKYMEKDEILERYMNTINLGQNTLGVEAAAQRYFGKSVSDLTLSECATIAVITQNPSKWNPISHPDNNAERRERCLKKMLELEFISQAEYDEAMADDVYARIERHNINYLENSSTSSYFVDALTYDVKQDLLAAGYSESNAETMLYSGGLRIMSTYDPDIQAIVDAAVANPENYPDRTRWLLSYALTIISKDGTQTNYSQEMMVTYFKENVDKNFDLIFSTQEEALEAVEQYKAALMVEGDDFTESLSLTIQPQVTAVVMDQSTGYVAAMAGGRGAKEGRLTLNRATDSFRQPGSTFKILAAYVPALDSANMSLATVFNDAPFYYDEGIPVNNWYDTGYKGLVNIRYAIEQSMNIIAVKTLTVVSPQLGYDYLKNFGFTKVTDAKVIGGKVYSDIQQATALGGITTGVSNEELTAAYAAIANGGVYIKPKLYTQVLTADGEVILDNTQTEGTRIIQETTAFLLTDAMTGVISRGTGTKVKFEGMSLAGKTGTTSDNRDVWFAGYSPYYTCVTWAGYDNNEKMISEGSNRETNIAKYLWKDIMEDIHAELPNAGFAIPEGIVQATICSRSGKIAQPGICDAYLTTEYFTEDSVPTEICDVHFVGEVCPYDHTIAAPECPFKYYGSCEVTPIEPEALYQGSTIPIEQPDGTIIYQLPKTSNYCQHDATFFMNPDYESILQGQQWEMQQWAAQAQAAAEAAAQQAEVQQ